MKPRPEAPGLQKRTWFRSVSPLTWWSWEVVFRVTGSTVIPTGLGLCPHLCKLCRPFSLSSNWAAALATHSQNPRVSGGFGFRMKNPNPERLSDSPKVTQLVNRRTGWLLEESSSRFFVWVCPRPRATQGSPGWAGTITLLHTCGAYQASIASQGFAMSLVLWPPHWTWSCWRAGVSPASRPLPRSLPDPGPESGPSKSLLNEGVDACTGAWRRNGSGRQAYEQQFVQEGRGDDWRNRTCKTGRWPNSFRLTSEQALITETS